MSRVGHVFSVYPWISVPQCSYIAVTTLHRCQEQINPCYLESTGEVDDTNLDAKSWLVNTNQYRTKLIFLMQNSPD